MRISELKGSKIKKSLKEQGVDTVRVVKRYHNKHVDNSGNFGFTIVINSNGAEEWFTLDGNYNRNKEITNAGFGRFSGGWNDLNTTSYEKLIEQIKELIKVK